MSLFSFFSPTACSFVVDNEWKTLNKEVVLLYQEGEYEKAAEVAKRALKAAEENARQEPSRRGDYAE